MEQELSFSASTMSVRLRLRLPIYRFFPFSKTCSKCGYINEHLSLNDREWECPRCNVVRDRDYNASQNILRQGLNLTVGTTELATCPDVRPVSNNRQLAGVEPPYVFSVGVSS
jgi:hypothetical protein